MATGLLGHRKAATAHGPNNPQKGSGRQGGTGDRHKRGEFGTITHYATDTHTATVRTEHGALIPGVPRLRSTPGEVVPLAVGTDVLVSHDYGPPIIMGVLTIPAGNNANTSSYSVTDEEGFGGEGLNKASIPAGNYRNAAEPRDLIPGDWSQVGEEGNLFALLGGGTNVMRSSAVAQIRTHLINDLVEIISRNFRHVTDMGEFKIENNDGRINMSFRGGTDQRSEAGPDEENWTIRMDLGATGDLFNLEFTTPQGQTLFKFHVDAEGGCEIFGINGINLASGSRIGGGHTEEHEGDSANSVGGSRTANTLGDAENNVGGNLTEDIGGDVTSTIGNDWRTQVLRDVAIGAGRAMAVTVQGPEIPGGTAMTYDIENGDWVVDIGGPSSPLSGFSMSTFTGDIKHASTSGGVISNETLAGFIENRSLGFKASTFSLPDSVILGGETIVSHLVKWEELFSYLTSLHIALDSHAHLIPSTAFAGLIPVTGATAQPIVPIGAPLAGLLATFRSLVAGVSS